MQEEIWKSILGWKGIYEISSLGRLKSFKTWENGMILSINTKGNNYISVVLSSGKTMQSSRIHRLVADHFIPNPENKPEVNHINGIKKDNQVENLEWCTRSENIKHAISLNPNIIKGINDHNKKRAVPVIQMNLKNEFINEFISSKEASIITGVCARNIHQVASKTEYKKGLTRKQAGGFIWKFKEIKNV